MDPTRLGPYAIRGRLGRGGMGTVYEAVDASGSAVAVKTLSANLSDDAGVRRRFEAEIEALKGLRHPGIVRLLAFGEEEGRPFFAMELVRGRSLEELLREGRRFDWRQTARVAVEITRALKSAHDQGIVHRDLKPANLLLIEDQTGGISVKLADFGIARLFGDTGHTQAGTVVGTAEYMAPEQAAGEPVDARADLYSLGLVMFAMLTGEPPFRGDRMAEVLRRQRSETPPRVSTVVPGLPAGVDDLIFRLLAKKPADRPAGALAVGRLLEAIDPGGGAEPRASVTVGPGGGPTVTGGGPARQPDVDLLAATRVPEAAPAAGLTVSGRNGSKAIDPKAATRPVGPAGSLPHRPTEPDTAPPPPVAPRGNRFTTVDELQEAARRAATRTARRDGILRLAVASGLLAAVVWAGYLVLRPASADQLHRRILAIAADPAADLRDARPLIDLFLSRFPADPRGAAVGELDRRLELDALERRTRRRPRDPEPPGSLERDYRAAMDREAESPLACLVALEAILALHDAEPDPAAEKSLWLDLVRRQIERVRPLAAREQAEDSARAEATLAEAARLATAAAAADTPDARGDLLRRRRDLLQGLVTIYAERPHVSATVIRARELLAAEVPATPPDAPSP